MVVCAGRSEFLDALRPRRAARARRRVGGRERAILHHDDVAGLDARALGEGQRNDELVGIRHQFDAIALQRAGQGAESCGAGGERAAGSERESALSRGELESHGQVDGLHVLVMPPMEM
jgi:hypothetical protein